MKKFISIGLACMMLLSLASCTLFKKDNPEVQVEQINIADGYTIVISEKATSVVKALSNDLVNAIKAKTEVKLERITDNTKKNDITDKEILLGVSDRNETKASLEKLTTTGYSISVIGQKLVIVASNDFMLEKAMKALTENYLTFDGAKANVAENLNITYDGTSEMSSLVDDKGNFKYQIIYPDSNENNERSMAEKLRLDVQKVLGCKVALIRSDIGIKADDAAYEILIGETDRPQSQSFYNNMDSNEIKILMEGNKILIGSKLSTGLEKAVSDFSDFISQTAKGTCDGKYMLQNGYSQISMVYTWLDNIAMMDTGIYRGANNIGDESMVFVWEDVDRKDYDDYLTDLKKNGLTEKQTYSLGDNSYMLLENELANVYVYYTPAKESVRLFVENKERGTLYPSAEQTSYSTVAGYQPKLWQVENDWKTALEWDTSLPEEWRGANAGMCYMMQVADGSFVIIDSGMNSKKQAEIIYEHLIANTTDEKPVISAWFISHAHADHTGGFQQFTKLYKDQVTVKAFYHNVPASGFGNGVGSGDASIVAQMKQYSGAKIYRKLHTGMSFYVADARFDVMYTHEDLYPVLSEDFNETTTVIRATFGGQRIMFLGDVQDEGGQVMIDTMPKSEMKSDIVQYAHHGWDGPTAALYDLIEAPTVLWPVSIYSWQYEAEGENIFKRMITTQNGPYFYDVNYYIAHEAEYVKTIIINAEGTGTQEFILPYTPRAERLPDYEAIYEAIKSKEDALKN